MSVTFNGTDSKITVASGMSPGYPYTIFCWLKGANTSQSTFPVSFGNEGGGSAEELAIYFDGGGSGKVRAWNVNIGSSQTANSTTSCSTSWTACMVVFTSSTSMDVYYGAGAGVNANPGQTPNFASINKFSIGNRIFNGSLWFNGDIAEVACWTSALTSGNFTTLNADVQPESAGVGTPVFHASLLTHTAFGCTTGHTLTGAGTLATGATHPITRSAAGASAPPFRRFNYAILNH